MAAEPSRDASPAGAVWSGRPELPQLPVLAAAIAALGPAAFFFGILKMDPADLASADDMLLKIVAVAFFWAAAALLLIHRASVRYELWPDRVVIEKMAGRAESFLLTSIEVENLRELELMGEEHVGDVRLIVNDGGPKRTVTLHKVRGAARVARLIEDAAPDSVA